MTVFFRTILSIIAGFLITCGTLPAGAQTLQLKSGLGRRFAVNALAQPLVLTGIAVTVPAGSTRLTISLDPDSPAVDLALFARFDRDVTVQAGHVVATDFTSDTPGSGQEQIVITPNSSPPLQTGTYYLAIGVITLQTAVAGSITATVEGGGNSGTFVTSTFETDADGWTRNFVFPPPAVPGATQGDPGSILSVVASGGTPGGYLSLSDAGGLNQDFAVVPARFLGNLAATTNPRLEFDYRHVSGQDALFPIVVRVASETAVFQWTSPEPPTTAWTHYRVPLRADALRLVSGTGGLPQALANVQRIEISMDQAPGPEVNGIDNFALIGDLSPGAPRTTPVTPVVSNFEGDSDGWGRSYPAAGVSGASIGNSGSTLAFTPGAGTPGGALVYNKAIGGGGEFFVAPPKFLGNLAGITNPQLEFDYRHVAQLQGLAPLVVRLLGAGAGFRWAGAPATATFQHFRVPLAEAFFVREFGTASFAQTLAAAERLEISADQSDTEEVDSLDNVMLVSAATPALEPSLLAAPAPLVFSATAGDTNAVSQTLTISSSADAGGFGSGVTWTASIEPPVSWLSLSATRGTTPLRIAVTATAGSLSPGAYNTTIVITAPGVSNSPQRVPVSLTVNPRAAAAPRINAGGVGNAASGRQPLSAGALASAFGSNLGPGDGVAAVFAPGTLSLPARLQGVRVLVEDAGGVLLAEAPLLFVSSTQINFQMPLEVGARVSIQVVVEKDGVASLPETAALAAASPGIFSFSGNRAAAQNQDFSLNGPGNPAVRGSVLIVYLTGPGTLSTIVPTGQAAPSTPLAQATAPVSATIGGVPASVLFLGLTPGLVGVAQANIFVPPEAPAGDQPLVITIAGQTSNTAIVSIR